MTSNQATSARGPLERLRESLSNIAAVAYKEATVIRHDKALMTTVFAQPVIMLLLFGIALSNKPANVPLLILDQDRSVASRRLAEDIDAMGYFLPPRYLASYDEGEHLLRIGEALAMVVVPSGFRRDLERGGSQVQVLLDGSDPLSSARVGSYLGQAIGRFDLRKVTPAAPRAFEVKQRFWFNPTLSDSKFFLAAIAGMLLTNLCLSGTSMGLVGERENGTFEQMLSLPTRPIELVLGKLVPYVGLTYVVLTFAIVASGIGFGYWPRGSIATIYAITLPFVLASLSIGVFVSTIAQNSAQAVFVTVFFILPSFVLSGAMMPYQLMPDGVREVGGIFPLRWYQIALRRVSARGGGFEDVAIPLLALGTIFVVLLLLIGRRFKPRLG